MIVMLLNSSLNLLGQTNNSSSSTGSEIKTDTAKATIPIYLIRNANIKMIELDYFKKLNTQKDSIIQFNHDYIAIQNKTIKDLNTDLYYIDKVNKDLNNTIKKQNKRIKILGYGFSAAIVAFVVGIFIH